MQAASPPLEYELVVEDLATSAPIGVLSLSGIDQHNKKAEFCCYFARRRNSRSLIEAMHLGFHCAFQALQLRKVICHYAPENRNVAGILSSLCFTTEGILRGELLDDKGSARDLIRASLFIDDWEAAGGPRDRLNFIAPLMLDGFRELRP